MIKFQNMHNNFVFEQVLKRILCLLNIQHDQLEKYANAYKSIL